MKKTIISLLLCAVMLLSLAGTAFAASTFKDVDAQKYSWAVNEIDEMAAAKIISGYNSTTFGPEDGVKRVDSLLLIARILGVNDEENQSYVDAAYEAFGAEVGVLSYKNYEQELAYLLYKGLYTPTELRAFLSNGLGDQPLKRHEAAILLTKMMGAEKTVKDASTVILNYSDASSIPVASQAYVEYCYNEGLMSGMENNEFRPTLDVTRAQMAVMLYNAMHKITSISYYGTVTDVISLTGTLRFIDDMQTIRTINYTAGSSIPFKFDGKDLESLDQIVKDDKLKVTYEGRDIVLIEGVKNKVDGITEGILSSKSTSSKIKKIQIRPAVAGDDQQDFYEYTLADDVVIVKEDKPIALSDLEIGDYITVTVQKGKVISIYAKASKENVAGTIEKFIYDPAGIQLRTASDELVEYPLASSVTVQKNGKDATVRDLMVGDAADIVLEYGIVKIIAAKSSIRTLEGTISEIVISKTNPKITIETSSGALECALSTGVTIQQNNQPVTVYDLKLDQRATVTMESTTVTAIDVSDAPVTGTTATAYGIVENVDNNYNVITIRSVSDDSLMQIFVKSGASIIDGQTQKAKKLNSIQVGQTITAVLTSSNGFVLEAVSIVVL